MDPDWSSISRYSLDAAGNLIDTHANNGQGAIVPHNTLQSVPGQPAPGAAPPVAGSPGKLPPGMTPQMALDQAKAAIASGKPRAAVIQRLQTLGIDPSGL